MGEGVRIQYLSLRLLIDFDSWPKSARVDTILSKLKFISHWSHR